MDYILVKEVAMVLRSLNHRTRQEILKNISLTKDISITELSKKMHLELSVLSQHIAILRKNKILNITRDGKFITYSINEEYMLSINNFIIEFITESKKY